MFNGLQHLKKNSKLVQEYRSAGCSHCHSAHGLFLIFLICLSSPCGIVVNGVFALWAYGNVIAYRETQIVYPNVLHILFCVSLSRRSHGTRDCFRPELITAPHCASTFSLIARKKLMFSSVSGFRGKNCEENIDDCPGNLCQNGATCIDDINRYSCSCPPSFMGELCEQDVDECSMRPSVCQNGATCTNTNGKPNLRFFIAF